MPYLPKNIDVFIEPFAGLGRITELVKANKYKINDMSVFAYNYLKDKFPEYDVENIDYVDFIKKHDAENTFMFLDPPWRKNIYQNHSKPAFTEKNIKSYYTKLLDILPECKCNWVITSDRAEVETSKMLSKSGYENIVLQVEDTPHQPKIFGRLPAVRLCSNMFISHYQNDLISYV